MKACPVSKHMLGTQLEGKHSNLEIWVCDKGEFQALLKDTGAELEQRSPGPQNVELVLEKQQESVGQRGQRH